MHKAADGVWADTMERCEIAPAVITVCRLRGFARNPTLKAPIVKLRRLTDSERPGTRTDRFSRRPRRRDSSAQARYADL